MPNRNLEKTDSSVLTQLHKKQFVSCENSPEASDGIKGIYFDLSMPLYGMSPQQYIEGTKYHNECFYKLNCV